MERRSATITREACRKGLDSAVVVCSELSAVVMLHYPSAQCKKKLVTASPAWKDQPNRHSSRKWQSSLGRDY